MPVRILGHHSGMSLGFYGTSHHSLEDLNRNLRLRLLLLSAGLRHLALCIRE